MSAVLDEHWEVQRSDWARVLQDDAEPLSRLRRLFEETEAGLRADQQSCGTVSGCMFGNLTLELSNQTEPIRERLQQIFDAQVEMVEKGIAEARERGEVTLGDARQAARSIVAQLGGQVLFAKLYNDTRHPEALWENCLPLLSVHRTDTAAVSSWPALAPGRTISPAVGRMPGDLSAYSGRARETPRDDRSRPVFLTKAARRRR